MNPSDLRYATPTSGPSSTATSSPSASPSSPSSNSTEPTFLELPKVGKSVAAGEAARDHRVGEVHVATFTRRSPGVVVERNESLIDDPATKRKGDLTPGQRRPVRPGLAGEDQARRRARRSTTSTDRRSIVRPEQLRRRKAIDPTLERLPVCRTS